MKLNPKIYPLRPVKVHGDSLILDPRPDWEIQLMRQWEMLMRTLFRYKCELGLKKNKVLNVFRPE